MSHFRAPALLLATAFLAIISPVRGAISTFGIEPITDQYIPSGKTLVVPIPASDPDGPARIYTVTVGPATINSGSSSAAEAGITATIRTGDPHFIIGVSYTDSNSVQQTGTMELQMLREFAPLTTQIIAGLTEGGFYSPKITESGTTDIIFHRVVPGFVIQGGDPNGNGSGGPGFTFPNEYNRALIFSGTANGGQLAMANSGIVGVSGSNVYTTSTSGTLTITSTTTTITDASNGTNGSQFYITLPDTSGTNNTRKALDYGYTLFGQMLRGFDTLYGIAGTALTYNSSGEFSSPINPVDITSAVITQNDTDAVVLLSGTGLCDAQVTVTAVSGSATTTGTFMAHTVADNVNDPPFFQSPPDITAPNGSVNVTLSGTDLQLDLLRYGYERLQPVYDPGLTTGTSRVVTIPLISSTNNTEEATVDQWNAVDSLHGFDEAVFHVGAGSKPITGSLTPVTTGSDGLTVTSSPIATFTAGNPADTGTGSFTTSVNWGDGTYLSGTEVTIVKETGAGNHYKLVAPHKYMGMGEFPLIVKIADPGGAHLTLTGTANIGTGSIIVSGTNFSNTGGKLKNQVVARIIDSGTTITTDYTTTIDWGDGTISPGVVKSAGSHKFQVQGTHNYLTADTFTVSVTVSRTGGQSGYEWSAAQITNPTAPQDFPPFPQAHLAQMWVIGTTSSNAVTSGTGTSDGANPVAPLVMGTDGNFYGTTLNGGNYDLGTVYQITSTGTYTTIHAFTGGSDGSNPGAGLMSGTDGDLYGTTSTGGPRGAGTVFKISTSGSLTTLYPFDGGNDGGKPLAGVITGSDGLLYGTTSTGGTNSEGTVYKISTSGSFANLYSFTGGSDGANPLGTLIQTGSEGYLYGTTETGTLSSSFGTVFQISTTGTLTTLYNFTAASDGGNPHSGLITGTDGNLYGTTMKGGNDGYGTVYKISFSSIEPPAFGLVYSFTGSSDGGQPVAPLFSGTDGYLYGTTQGTGTTGSTGTNGTVYQLSYSGSLGSLHTFTGGSDGANPQAALIAGTDGYLYGTSENGGASTSGSFGTVFQTTTGGNFTTIHTFNGGAAAAANDGYQIAISGAVAIVNSGNKPSLAGFLPAYTSGTDGSNQEALTSGTQTSIPIQALQPGQSQVITFRLEGTVSDTRLKLPIDTNFGPIDWDLHGVVHYDDPVGDFDGSAKDIKVGPFSP